MPNNYQLVSYNKEYYSADSFKIELSNRAFKYGDGFFETMHANGLEVQFIDDHIERIHNATGVLKLALPDYFSSAFLKNQIAGLLTRMKLFQGVRVRVSFVRSGEGLYTPQTNSCDILIEAAYLSKGLYELNEHGLTIGVYDEEPYIKTHFNGFKSMNALSYVLAANYAKENGYGDVLLIDEKGRLIEATSSNFFALKGKELFTPDLAYGGVAGIMRKQILRIGEELGYNVQEKALYESELENMDELFLTNAVLGIRYISGFKRKRYYKRVARKFVQQLNDRAF